MIFNEHIFELKKFRFAVGRRDSLEIFKFLPYRDENTQNELQLCSMNAFSN